MVDCEKLKNKVVGDTLTKLKLLSIKAKVFNIEFCTAKGHLVDENNPLISKNVKDLESKIKFFSQLDHSKRLLPDNISVINLGQVFLDILLGLDSTKKVPINTAIVYSKIGSCVINYENSNFFRFLNAIEGLGDMFSYSNIKIIRPFLRPLLPTLSNLILRKNKLKKADLDEINKLIVKEYFRIIGWNIFGKGFEGTDGRNISNWLVFGYKKGSLLYQLFFGETNNEIDKQFEEFKKKEDEKLSIQKALQTTNTYNQEVTTNKNPNFELNNAVLDLASGIHLHIKVQTELAIEILNSSKERDVTLRIQRLDFNLVQPIGTLALDLAVLLFSFSISIVYNKSEQNADMKRAKQSIFGGAGSIRSVRSNLLEAQHQELCARKV